MLIPTIVIGNTRDVSSNEIFASTKLTWISIHLVHLACDLSGPSIHLVYLALDPFGPSSIWLAIYLIIQFFQYIRLTNHCSFNPSDLAHSINGYMIYLARDPLGPQIHLSGLWISSCPFI